MLKLSAYSYAFMRLWGSKHSNIKVINKVSLAIVNNLKLLLGHNIYSKKHYCTYQQKYTEIDSNGNEVENEGPDIKAITAGNTELEQKLKVLILEAEVMRQEGHNIPSNSFLKKQHWEELLSLSTKTARRKYYTFLFKLEKKKENLMRKREEKRLIREKEIKKNPLENEHIIYSLQHNNIFLRFYDTTINNFYNSKLIEAIMFGQKLVVDCGYDKLMNKKENVNCAKQLMILFGDNRVHDEPFDLHFCNLDKNSELEKALHKQIVTMYEPWFPLNIHEKSYSDIFPNEKLIYLTPHCREEMLEYDHDAIYIIGGIVDKARSEPASLGKAKKEGLKMLKFPLDKYLQWSSGSGKNLTLNQVVSVLLDIKKTGDWKYALRHVPKRKLFDFHKYSSNKNTEQQYDEGLNTRRIGIKKNIAFDNKFGRNKIWSKSKVKLEVKSIFYD